MMKPYLEQVYEQTREAKRAIARGHGDGRQWIFQARRARRYDPPRQRRHDRLRERAGDEEIAERVEHETDHQMDQLGDEATVETEHRLYQCRRLEWAADARQERRDHARPEFPGQVGRDAGHQRHDGDIARSGGTSGFAEGIVAESAVDMSSLLEREAFLRPAECRQARRIPNSPRFAANSASVRIYRGRRSIDLGTLRGVDSVATDISCVPLPEWQNDRFGNARGYRKPRSQHQQAGADRRERRTLPVTTESMPFSTPTEK